MTSAYIDKFMDAADAFKAKPMTTAQLMDERGITENTARKYVDQMAKRGWIKPDGHDEHKGPGLKPVRWRWV